MADKDNTHIHVMMKKIRDTMHDMHGWGAKKYDSTTHAYTQDRANYRLLDRGSLDSEIYKELMAMWKDLQERCNGGHCDWFGSISALEFCRNVAKCELAMEDLGILGAADNDENA